jgi:GNAT superfamily N-acetyltransferase
MESGRCESKTLGEASERKEMERQQRNVIANAFPSSRKIIRTSAGELVLHMCCSPSLVETLRADDGLRAFARYPQREHRRLLALANCPDATVSLAATFSGEIVGEMSLTPADAWWKGLEHVYELAIQVSSRWRRLGIAHQLLDAVLSLDVQEERILLGMGFSWHWDTRGLGIDPQQYRQFLERLCAHYGFWEYLTVEPNICMDPANLFLVRIGRRVEQKAMNRFLNHALVGPFQGEESDLQ